MRKYFSKSQSILSNKKLQKEVTKRAADMEANKAQTYTWAEVKQRAEISLATTRASQK